MLKSSRRSGGTRRARKRPGAALGVAARPISRPAAAAARPPDAAAAAAAVAAVQAASPSSTPAARHAACPAASAAAAVVPACALRRLAAAAAAPPVRRRCCGCAGLQSSRPPRRPRAGEDCLVWQHYLELLAPPPTWQLRMGMHVVAMAATPRKRLWLPVGMAAAARHHPRGATGAGRPARRGPAVTAAACTITLNVCWGARFCDVAGAAVAAAPSSGRRGGDVPSGEAPVARRPRGDLGR